MKRDDLAAGQDYLLSDDDNWHHNLSAAYRVRVLDVEPWQPAAPLERYSTTFDADGRTFAVLGRRHQGEGVLVTFVRADGTVTALSDIESLDHLRGPWADAWGQAVERRTADLLTAAADRDTETAAEARFTAARARAAAVLGVTFDPYRGLYGHAGGVASIETSVLEALVSLAEVGARK